MIIDSHHRRSNFSINFNYRRNFRGKSLGAEKKSCANKRKSLTGGIVEAKEKSKRNNKQIKLINTRL
jgi:hypothetical protein